MISELEIPLFAMSNIPVETLLITEFLKLEFPTQLYSSITSTKTKAWFSRDFPDLSGSNLVAFWSRPIPSAEQIKKLFEVVGEEWHTGAHSVTDLTFNDGMDQLPLWVLNYWKQMGEAICAQTTWQACKNWLECESLTKEAAEVMKSTLASFHCIG